MECERVAGVGEVGIGEQRGLVVTRAVVSCRAALATGPWASASVAPFSFLMGIWGLALG